LQANEIYVRFDDQFARNVPSPGWDSVLPTEVIGEPELQMKISANVEETNAAILEWRVQGNVLIELFKSINVLGKWPKKLAYRTDANPPHHPQQNAPALF
jgi:hypothetical protein